MPLGVLLADSHPIVREGLKSILQGKGFAVLHECSDGQEAVKLAESAGPDIAILEVSMPRLNGIDAARRILQVSPRTTIALLTAGRQDDQVIEALHAGVKGYILKTEDRTALIHAIEEVSRGNIYLSPGVSGAIVSAYRKRTDPNVDPLSKRELQILTLIAEGQTAREIAHQAKLSVKTVETYRKNLMEKLGIRETANLVRYAIRRQLIKP